jgi:large subunit ribosomal protein L6
MSRIGKAIISIPAGVDFKVTDGNHVSVKGPKGELHQVLKGDFDFDLTDGVLTLKRNSEDKDVRAMHGLYRALINNMVEGVTNGFTVKQELVGVGYRAKTEGQRLELTLGYAHPIVFEVPKEIKILAETEKGKNPVITLQSHDKQLIGQVAAKIRSFRKPEPYKGKGIRFVGELVRRKAGKSAGK